jgi:hypothetical protein
MFSGADAWLARYQNCGFNASDTTVCIADTFVDSTAADAGPPGAWVRTINACDAAIAPDNGDAGDCTDTLASGSSCQPTCTEGYTISGTSSCTDRVLKRATCPSTP